MKCFEHVSPQWWELITVCGVVAGNFCYVTVARFFSDRDVVVAIS